MKELKNNFFCHITFIVQGIHVNTTQTMYAPYIELEKRLVHITSNHL